MQDETTLVGQIGWITKGILRGYVYAPDDLDRRIVFELYVNDLPVGEFTAEKPRPDLVEINIGDGAYGFALPMTAEHVIAGRNKVEVMVPGTKTVIVRKYVTQTEEQVDALAPGGLTFASHSPTATAEKTPDPRPAG